MKPFLIALILAGCAHAVESQSNDGFYQKDLIISESNRSITGFGVLPKQSSYNLKIRSRKEPELVRLSNCHRDVILRDIDDDKLNYRYIPNPKVEDGSCLLQISFLDSKGHHQFGAVSFQDDETLDADLNCNGQKLFFNGASTCQAKAGTLQTIEFQEKVEVKGIDQCKLPTSDDGYFWEYSIKEGFCLFLFKSEDSYHKLTTYGYDRILNQ